MYMNRYMKSSMAHKKKCRGASFNPPNRFSQIEIEVEYEDDENSTIKTLYFKDTSRSIISYNDSPDLGFCVSLNPYRGCEHGCIYCYARPTHEYLGFSCGLDFESKILVKENAHKLLEEELSSSKYKPDVLVLSGVTDPYQPVEKHLNITRKCLEVLLRFRNPVVIITKNHLVTRDIDILKEMAKYDGCAVNISITTLDNELRRLMEPRTSAIEKRLDAIKQLAHNNIAVGVMVAPIIPALNDVEIPKILECAAMAGAKWASYTLLRLPYAVKDLFIKWLGNSFPLKKTKIIGRIMEIKGGVLNNGEFFKRFEGYGAYAQHIDNIFTLYAKKYSLNKSFPCLALSYFKRSYNQNTLF